MAGKIKSVLLLKPSAPAEMVGISLRSGWCPAGVAFNSPSDAACFKAQPLKLHRTEVLVSFLLVLPAPSAQALLLAHANTIRRSIALACERQALIPPDTS